MVCRLFAGGSRIRTTGSGVLIATEWPRVKAISDQSRHTNPRCAIAALAAYARTRRAETPRLSHRRWWTRDCFGLNASQRVGSVSPIPARTNQERSQGRIVAPFQRDRHLFHLRRHK
jgi:hypothetical protein